jgi:hypothetical protein
MRQGGRFGKPRFELPPGELQAQNDGADLVEADEVEGALADADVDAENGDGVFGLPRHGRGSLLPLTPVRRGVLRGSTAGPSH